MPAPPWPGWFFSSVSPGAAMCVSVLAPIPYLKGLAPRLACCRSPRTSALRTKFEAAGIRRRASRENLGPKRS